jgi:hypothetical protein
MYHLQKNFGRFFVRDTNVLKKSPSLSSREVAAFVMLIPKVLTSLDEEGDDQRKFLLVYMHGII